MSSQEKAPKVRAFLAAIRLCPNVTMAARAVGIPRDLHYGRYRRDAAYRKAFDDAWELGIQSIEDAVVERMMEGVPEPIVYKGRICYERDEKGELMYDEEGKPIRLIMQRYSVERERLILRGLRPERYKDSAEVTGLGGKPLLEKLEVVFRSAKGE